MDICERCGRPRPSYKYDGPVSPEGTIVIGHGGYGCDTGCCGLEAIYLRPGDKRSGGRIQFDFMHREAEFVADVQRKYPTATIVRTCWQCFEFEDDNAHTQMDGLSRPPSESKDR